MFQNTATAHRAISFGASYLAGSNIGLLGSHGYTALPLAATILAYGVGGLASWGDHEISLAERLVARIESHRDLEQWGTGPGSGVIAWRHKTVDSRTIQSNLEGAFVSVTNINGEDWLRSVAANPLADPDRVVNAVLAAAGRA